MENKILKADGNAYEDLFLEIARAKNPNIKGVKPRGQLGDRKNDGFDSQNGIYYQVYAPEAPDQSFGSAITKAKKDFEGLYDYWNTIAPIKEYYFVFNDKFKGTHPDLEKVLAEIKSDYSLEYTGSYLSPDLLDDFLSLSTHEIASMFGLLPTSTKIGTLDYEIIDEVISYIIEFEEETPFGELKIPDPDFEKKIMHNSLSDDIRKMLDRGGDNLGALEDYFLKYGKGVKEDLAKKLNKKYKSIRDSLYEEHGIIDTDLVFVLLYESIIKRKTNGHYTAVFAILYYYFETCDIFEEPK